VRTGSISSLAEEASPAYKDVSDVVAVAERVELSRRVVRTKPLGVIKG
jgi:tRNA-splicing ligase RtcB